MTSENIENLEAKLREIASDIQGNVNKDFEKVCNIIAQYDKLNDKNILNEDYKKIIKYLGNVMSGGKK